MLIIVVARLLLLLLYLVVGFTLVLKVNEGANFEEPTEILFVLFWPVALLFIGAAVLARFILDIIER